MLSEFLCLSFSLVFCYFTSHLLFFTHICGSWKVLKFSGVIVPLHNLKQLSPHSAILRIRSSVKTRSPVGTPSCVSPGALIGRFTTSYLLLDCNFSFPD